MATQNSINNASGSLTVDPGASGDSFIQYNINTTGEFRIGIDDDAADAFIIAQGSALGGTDTFIMSADGERTMPLQPAFLAYNSSTDLNVTGDATQITIKFDTEIYDQNGDYNTSTYTFTAPITGRYFLGVTVRCEGLTASHTSLQCWMKTSNRTYRASRYDIGALRNADDDSAIAESSIDADMDAADTAYFEVVISFGTKVVDIVGNSVPYTRFWGHLAC